METYQKLRIWKLYLKALVRLVSMINGLHLQYLVHAQERDTRSYFFFTGFCYFLSSFMLSILNILLLHLQHGAAVIDDKIYIFGGNHNGRYLSDLQVCKICLMHASSCHL